MAILGVFQYLCRLKGCHLLCNLRSLSLSSSVSVAGHFSRKWFYSLFFPSGYSCFLDVDFYLITQTMRHSVKFQGLIWPVGLMRQLIRALIGSPSEGGKDFSGIKIWGATRLSFQQSVHHPSFFLSFPRLAKLFPEVFQYGLHCMMHTVVIQGEINLF